MYRIKTPQLDVIATEGCEWLVEYAYTVRMNGYMDGLGSITKDSKGTATLEIDVETFGRDKDTGEPNTVTWTFTGSSTLSVMTMLVEQVGRVIAADLKDAMDFSTV